MASPDIAFVIPAFNEQKFIGDTIESVRLHAARYAHEIIVVDHGSKDATREIAERAGAKVLVSRDGTIGSLRNLGAAAASAPVLVFIDADVRLTAAWSTNFEHVLSLLKRSPLHVTGAPCDVPQNAHWVSRYWFRHDPKKDYRYIGTGHLITSAKLFKALNGFNTDLQTGEDYDFCRRALDFGATLKPDVSLRTLHYGVPHGCTAFIRRETWHGLGDWRCGKAALKSKVVIVTILFWLAHAALIASLLIGSTAAAASSFFVVAALCTASSVRKYRRFGLKAIAVNTGIYYLYYIGRGVSLWKALVEPPKKHVRA